MSSVLLATLVPACGGVTNNCNSSNQSSAYCSIGGQPASTLSSAGPTANGAATTTAGRNPGPTDSATGTSGSDAGGNQDQNDPGPVALSSQYLSQLQVVDYDHESGTGEYDTGVRTINGKQFGHAVAMAAGCQNDDGGDYWIDFSIGDWKNIDGQIGLTDKSSTESTGTYTITDAVTQRVLGNGGLHVGPAVPFHSSVEGVARIRIFMTDPNAPQQACGFEHIHTALVLGDFRLTK